MIKVVDTDYQPEFEHDIASKVSAKILGINVILDNGEFYLTADYEDKFVGLEALGYLSKQIS